MTNFERVSQYVYRRYNKYHVVQNRKTLTTASTPDEAIILKEQLIREGIIKPKLRGPYPNRNPHNRHITKTSSGTYTIRKRLHGKFEHFGTYKTIEDAREERDYLENIGWDYDNME